ncbi:MAG: 50S ribosomal protein L22 [Fimbriimonadaceae bacterium]|nr:50S ribosomal protein L22 [Fimbriimonadaceae bacterium]
MPNRQKRKAEQKQQLLAQPRAVSPSLRMSASKVRRIADLVRGVPVAKALSICDFVPHRAAPEVRAIVQQAAANAVENCGLDEDLYVSEIFVDEGFTIPRIRPRAQGRAYRIRKRTCRLTVVVAEREE